MLPVAAYTQGVRLLVKVVVEVIHWLLGGHGKVSCSDRTIFLGEFLIFWAKLYCQFFLLAVLFYLFIYIYMILYVANPLRW